MRKALLALVLALSGAGAACAPAPNARSAPDLPDLEVPGLEVRALLLLLVDQQHYEPFAIEQALKGDAALREELAVSLGRIPDFQGRGVLQGLLIDDVPAVRRAAAFALGELEDPEARPALLKALEDPDRETGMLAVEALGKLGTPVIEVVERLLPLDEQERWGRLLPYLFRFKEERTVALAERGLALPDPALHRFAAYALAREPRPEAAPLLRGLAADPDPRVRAWAARALGLVGGAEDVAVLRPLLEDADPAPAVHALRSVRALAAAGKAEIPVDWSARLLQLVDDPRPGVRTTVLEVCGLWLAAEPDGPLAAALATRAADGEAWERGLALVALGTAKHPRAAGLAASAAGSPDVSLRARSAEAAGLLGLPAGAETLTRLAGDSSPRVRAAALAGWLAADPEAAAVAQKALADPDVSVRATALDWLAEHPVAPLATLEASLAGLLQEGGEEAGLAALRALAARAEAEPLERGALIALLERAAAKGPYVLRREAGAALGRLEQPVPALAPVATGKSVDTYREIIQRTRRPRTVEIRTARGPIRVRLACPQAPLTCLNFLQLAAQGYYDGLTFHRVVPDFVVQGGDPRGDGTGGPNYSIRDEINRLRYERGVLGMALAGPDTGGSQFYLTLASHPHLDGGYTAFGQVIGGDAVLDQIRLGDRIETIVEVQ